MAVDAWRTVCSGLLAVVAARSSTGHSKLWTMQSWRRAEEESVRAFMGMLDGSGERKPAQLLFPFPGLLLLCTSTIRETSLASLWTVAIFLVDFGVGRLCCVGLWPVPDW